MDRWRAHVRDAGPLSASEGHKAESGPGSLAWSNPKLRALVYQGLALALAVAIVWFAAATAYGNLREQHIASGFGFLGETAGFGIVQHLIPYTEASTYGRAFVVGLLNTLLVAAIGIVLATVIGFSVGIARLSSNWLISRLAAAYVEILRNIPLLLQIFFWYFAVLRTLPSPGDSLEPVAGIFLNNRGLVVPRPVAEPAFWAVVVALAVGLAAFLALRRWAKARQMATGQPFPLFWPGLGLIVGLPALAFLATGLPLGFDIAELQGFNFEGGLTLLPEFVALTLALTIYTGAFIAENVRAGIQSVDRGQKEAAEAVGLTEGQVMRLVILPQAMKVIVPPLTSQYLNLTKNSSLAVAIGYPDLVSVFAGTVLNQTGQAIEVIAMTMAVYLTISLVTSFFMNLYNARVGTVER